MHGVGHAIAAYYQNPFDNKILFLLKIKSPVLSIYCMAFVRHYVFKNSVLIH